MKSTERMPETAKLWNEIQEATNTTKLNARKADLEREKQNLLRDKALAETLTEFKESERKINEVEEKIIEIERELTLAKFTVLNAHENMLPKLKGVYNAEFEKYKNEHEKLYAELEKHLKEFCRKVEPIVSRIDEIEKMEQDASSLKTFGIHKNNDGNGYLNLKRRNFTFQRPYGLLNPMHREFIPSLIQVLKVIKDKF